MRKGETTATKVDAAIDDPDLPENAFFVCLHFPMRFNRWFTSYLLAAGFFLAVQPLCAAKSAWRTTVPSYPSEALAKRVDGQGTVRVITDAAGMVKEARMVRSTGSAVLDVATVNNARTYWQGPPNATATIPVEYRLPPVSKGPAQPKAAHPGWTIPGHPYPLAASDVYEQGRGVIRAITDGTGQVKSAAIVRSTGYARLDADGVDFAEKKWRGPAASSIEVPVVYKLDTAVPVVPSPGPGRRWNIPKPYYPSGVLSNLNTGDGVVHVSTDARGRVVRAVMVQSTGNPALDENTVNYALARWSGRPTEKPECRSAT